MKKRSLVSKWGTGYTPGVGLGLWAVYWEILVREGGCEDFGYFGGMGLAVLLDCAIQGRCFYRNMRLLTP